MDKNLQLQDDYPYRICGPDSAGDYGAVDAPDINAQELLRLIEDLVIAWVDSGEDAREASSERIRARKALECSMLGHIEALERQLAELRIANASYENRIASMGESLVEAGKDAARYQLLQSKTRGVYGKISDRRRH